MSEFPASSRADSVFYEALQFLDADKRRRFVEKECDGNTALRIVVERLLKAHAAAPSGFLEDGPGAAFPISCEQLTFSRVEHAGDNIGPYRLVQSIGEGGFGTVWMAEQEQPVRRRVALKIIKPGMDSREVIARFEQERQALALMDHPNIATVLDAGTTSSGRPFFAMELVQGTRITDFCDQSNLSPSERLRLFVQVCSAVQHAHQKGIIHRDLKPSNILIALHDGIPVPKVIDFGVAKATQQRLTDLTLLTRIEQIIGTPLYMSPEQATQGGIDVDTRSDIYSLGVLLYELLTGKLPFDPVELMSRGLDEVRRVIREEEPPRPSTALTNLGREALHRTAQQRGSEPPKLIGLLRGDLDWIVMRALEKDRTRRYGTASAFAEDIQRHLANEPVLARPPSAVYRLRKLVRRNKVVISAGVSVAVTILAAISLGAWQAVRISGVLDELRETAPAFAEQAHGLVEKGLFDMAIEKLDYAAKLRPDASEYLAAKADLLESQLRLDEALIAYRAALRLDPKSERVQTNATLCKELIAANPEPKKLSRENLSKLFATMQREQRSAAQLTLVAKLLGNDKQIILEYWLERLKELPISPERPLRQRLTVRSDGFLMLDLSYSGVTDLGPLQGMPLDILTCEGCTGITDVRPLQGMPLRQLILQNTGVYEIGPLTTLRQLEWLNLTNTKVLSLEALRDLPLKVLDLSGLKIHDISALRGLQLEGLDVSGTYVVDLSPLRQMPLKWLDLDEIPATVFAPLSGLQLENLSMRGTQCYYLNFLRGIPLKELYLSGCNAVGLSELMEVPTLEVLAIPERLQGDPHEIASLRNHPRLQRLGFESVGGKRGQMLLPKTQFWQEWDNEAAIFGPIRTRGIAFRKSVLPDGTWSVELNGQPIEDLSFLKGAPISHLELRRTNVTNLHPLLALPLKALALGETKITDISSLAGLPLEELELMGTPVTDLTPLQGMPLRRLNIDRSGVTDITPLRGIPLQELWMGTTNVADLSPLKGAPLRLLQIDSCPNIRDISPLLGSPQLEQVLLPRTATNVELLRSLTNLKYISYQLDRSGLRPSQTSAEFWSISNQSTLRELADAGRFRDLAHVLEQRVANHSSSREWNEYYELAVVYLVLNDLAGYRATCATMFRQFRNISAEDVLYTSCLAPDSGISKTDLAGMLDYLQKAHGNNLEQWEPSLIACGVAEFRLGHYPQAAELLQKMIKRDSPRATAAVAVMAMIHSRHADFAAAEALLARNRDLAATRWLGGPGDLGNWQSWLAAHILTAEAEQCLIECRGAQVTQQRLGVH